MVDHVQRIEAIANLRHDGFLERVRSGLWRTLNGFTHGGMEQLSRRISSDRVGPNYSEGDKIMAILLAAEFSLIAALVTLEIGGKMDLAREAEGLLMNFSEVLERDGAAIRITDEVGRFTPSMEME